MSILDEQITKEVNMYVRYCELAAKHEADEALYLKAAHAVFYHIQEMRQTGQPTILGRFVKPPIS